MTVSASSKLPSGRAKLTQVIRAAGDLVRIDDAELVLNMGRNDAAKLLARWSQQGWLKRVGPGIYVPVPLDSLDSEHVLEDPWILVPSLFAPAYIGGWSAAEYWDLTEQIFRDIVVVTEQHVRSKKKAIHGATFILRHVPDGQIFGTKTVWRGQIKIAVADVHRTIVDMLADPFLGGGIQHVADCFREYVARNDCDFEKLINYAERIGNGAIFKRMGFLAEHTAGAMLLTELCHSKITKGHAKLDPSLDCPRIVSRWRIRIPESWRGGWA